MEKQNRPSIARAPGAQVPSFVSGVVTTIALIGIFVGSFLFYDKIGKKPEKENAAAPKNTASCSLLAWVVAPVLGIIAMPTVLLLVVGMALTLVAFFTVDRRPSKYATRAVGYLNFSCCLPYVLDLWRGGGVWKFEVLFMIITDPFTLLVMDSVAGIGWMVLFGTLPFVAAYLAVTSEMREKTLKARQTEIITEWGRNVRLGIMSPEIEDEDDGEEEANVEVASPSS